MVAQAIDYRRHIHRQIGYVFVGVALLLGAGYLGYDVYERRSNTIAAPSAYTYTINQSLKNKVNYFQNSFYENGPGENTAYVMDLTNTLSPKLEYMFEASEERELSYTYDVKAVVRGKYSFKGDDPIGSNVWTKEFQLVAPVHEKKTTRQLSISPSVTVPYAEYRQLLDQLRTALVLPVDGEVVVVFSIHVTGDIDGTKLDDTRISSVTAPVGTQIYETAAKYDRQDSKQIVPVETQAGIARWVQYEEYAAAGLGALALAAFVYGLRKKIFKTPYQRELDKIYRYHDGIIVRASRPADLSGKRMVAVKSFDDMLNLEEELKLPIVAASVNAEATQFMIIRDDVVYIYTLGKITPVAHGRSLEEIANTVHTSPPRAKVPRRVQ